MRKQQQPLQQSELFIILSSSSVGRINWESRLSTSIRFYFKNEWEHPAAHVIDALLSTLRPLHHASSAPSPHALPQYSRKLRQTRALCNARVRVSYHMHNRFAIWYLISCVAYREICTRTDDFFSSFARSSISKPYLFCCCFCLRCVLSIILVLWSLGMFIYIWARRSAKWWERMRNEK